MTTHHMTTVGQYPPLQLGEVLNNLSSSPNMNGLTERADYSWFFMIINSLVWYILKSTKMYHNQYSYNLFVTKDFINITDTLSIMPSIKV